MKRIPREQRNYWQRVYYTLFIMDYCDDVDQVGGLIFPFLIGALLIWGGFMAIFVGVSTYVYEPCWGCAILMWIVGSLFFFPAFWEVFIDNK